MTKKETGFPKSNLKIPMPNRRRQVTASLQVKDEIDIWAAAMTAEHKISGAKAQALLNEAAECRRRIRQARIEIYQYGVTVEDRYESRKTNPACKIEHEASNRLIACLKALDLPEIAAPEENQFARFVKAGK